MINISAYISRWSHGPCFVLIFFGRVFFFSRAAGSTGDERDSVFPKVGLGYAHDCLACVCGKPMSNSTVALYFLIAT